MKTMIYTWLILITAGLAVAVHGGGDVEACRVYFEAAIDQEIADCRAMSALRSSRSAHLRLKGHREASKALFLETHKAQLVERMVALNMAPKPYKVDRFLNDRFSCTCYAQWAPPGKI